MQIISNPLSSARQMHLLLCALVFSFCFLASGRKTARLSWQDNSDNEDGFRIYRITGDARVRIAEVGKNVTTYVDYNASPKACYVVTAFNSAGESLPTNKACLPD